MTGIINPYVNLPFVNTLSSNRKLSPTVLDLGADNLLYNPQSSFAGQAFGLYSAGGIFATVEGFLAAATANFTTSARAATASALNSASQSYLAAADLLVLRDTAANERLRELLAKTGTVPLLTAPGQAPAPAAHTFTPLLTANTGTTVAEGGRTTLTTAQLSAFDADTKDANVVFSVVSGPLNGHLELAANAGTPVTSFTQADLAAGNVVYVHNGSQTTGDFFTFSVGDGATSTGLQSFNIAVAAVDNAPALTRNRTLTVAEGDAATITTALLSASDIDTNASHLTYTVTSGPVNGQLELSTNPGTAITSFTQADLAAGRVKYVHDGSETASDGFTFQLSDATTAISARSFNIDVTPVDDAPVLTTDTGATVHVFGGNAAIITTAQLSASDVDTPDANLTYSVTSAPSGGRLELTTNPGAAISSFTQADLAAGIVRYVHTAFNFNADSFTFRLSDATTALAPAAFNLDITL